MIQHAILHQGKGPPGFRMFDIAPFCNKNDETLRVLVAYFTGVASWMPGRCDLLGPAVPEIQYSPYFGTDLAHFPDFQFCLYNQANGLTQMQHTVIPHTVFSCRGSYGIHKGSLICIPPQ